MTRAKTPAIELKSHKKLAALTLLATLLLCAFTAKANVSNPIFEHFSTNKNSVYACYRDADGILWLGTSNGLITYAQLQSSFHPYYRYDDAMNNTITGIRQDNIGRLWLKTQALRYIVYDPHNNSCISDVEAYLRQLGNNFKYQFYVYIDSRGHLWAFKDNHLFFKDFKSGRSRRINSPFSAGQITKLTDDGTRLIIVSRNAVFELKGNNLRYITSTPEPITQEETFLTLDKKGTLWVAANLKLMSFSPSNRQWKVHPEIKPDINGLLGLPNGYVCVSTTNNGLFVYDSEGYLYYNVVQTAPFLDGLQNSHLQSIYYDQTTNSLLISYHKNGLSLWTGQEQNGIQKFHIQSPSHDYIVEDVICFESFRGGMIAGTEDNGIYEVSADGTVLSNKYPGTSATAVMCDREGRVWTGLYHGGLVCPDGRRLFPNQSPYSIIQPTPAPDKLFVVLNGNGIWAVNPATGESRRIPIDNPWVMDMVESNGKLFAATPKDLYIIDPISLHVDTVSASRFSTESGFYNGTKDLAADHLGRIWIASNKDNATVCTYDSHSGKVTDITPLRGYNVKAMAEDTKGNMWFTTDKGIVCLSKGYKATLFADNALYNQRALYRLSDGRMVAGTTEGYEIFNPNRLLNSSEIVPEKCPLILASLHINGNNITPNDTIDGHLLITSDLPYVQNLDLDYDEKNIILEYLPRDMGLREPMTWYYSIKGLDRDDLPLIGGRIQLSNLRPGTYEVDIYNNNTNGEKFVYKVLTIHVSRPWWWSWWAIAIYIIVLGLTSLFVYRYRRRRTIYRCRISEMNEQARREKALDKIKINFFTNISHDLRTPLTLIITPIEELIDKATDGETRSILELINKNAHRLYDLVNQILDIKKVNLPTEVLHTEDTDVVSLTRGIVDSFSLMAKKNKQKLTFSSSESSLVTAIDVDKMSKVVMNLLSNAFKFTPKGGSISVEVSKKDDEFNIIVADTGKGIDKERRARIFDRYYTTTDQQYNKDGKGIGLSIVKDYVELHHGSITVADNKPQGTVFTITMPITLSAINASTFPTQHSTINTPHSTFDTQHSTINTPPSLLLVEDNTDLLSYMAHVLEKEYTIYQATDGKQALDIIRTTNVDIIISDVMMQGMDGLELCRQVKGDINTSHIPVILLTAKALDSDQLQGLQMGADDYIVKPFNFDILRQRIRNILKRTEQAHVKFQKDIDINPSAITVTTLDEEFLKDAIASVEKHISEPGFSVDDLAKEMNMHRTNLYRKILAVTGKTPLQFIRSLKMKRAHQLMSRGGVFVSQIAYKVGYNSPKTFARYFKEEYGVYPSEFMKNIN